ncbi:LamG domain-containing protein [Candidatus Pacearchaeota archaeon]|nr:LamG domain-containing protein [Candidatus Pacearchaeota archaeon]
MVHEKFTYKDGKQYGPYLYENKRVDGKIVTSYVGKQGQGTSMFPKLMRFWLIILLCAFFLVGLFIWVTGDTSTGQVSVEFDPVFIAGEPLAGTVKFLVKEGELVPQNARVVLRNGNITKELFLSEASVQAELLSGAFFAEGVTLAGSGEGYGARGTRTITPVLDFQLLITASDEESTSGGASLVAEEIASEGEEADETEETTSSLSSEERSILTGEVIIEDAFTVEGKVSLDDSFSYVLTSGQEATLVRGSVLFNGTELQDDVISLERVGNQVRVETEYVVEEEGFGEAFLGDVALTLTLDLSSFDFVANDSSFSVLLTYEGTTIASASKALNVASSSSSNLSAADVLAPAVFGNLTGNLTNATETMVNQTVFFLGTIPLQRIAPNGSLVLNVSEYFSGAENLSFLGEHLNASFDGFVLTLTSEAGFTGATRGSVIGWNESMSASSNEFTILVSSGAVSLTTARSRIKVDEPVKWVTNVSLAVAKNVTITLPSLAENIRVVAQTEEGVKEPLEVASLLTGEVVIELAVEREFFLQRWVRALFKGITGNVVDEAPVAEELTLALDEENADSYLVSYYTGAPTASEVRTSNGKQITISGPDAVEYTDVIAFTTLDNTLPLADQATLSLVWHTFSTEIGTTLKTVDEVPLASITESTEEEFFAFSEEKTEKVAMHLLEEGGFDTILTSPSSEETVSTDEGDASTFDSLLTGNVIGDVSLENVDETPSTSSTLAVTSIIQPVPFDAYDLDGDGNIDYLEWVVPHLSNQSFSLIFTSGNSSTPGNNVTFEGTGEQQFSHLTIDNSAAPFSNLLAYYSFDNDNASTLFDFSPYNKDMTFGGGALSNSTNCLYGNCIQLDGVETFASGSDTGFPTGAQNRSISLWMRSSAQSDMIAYYYGTNEYSKTVYLGIYSDTSAECPNPAGIYTAMIGTNGVGTNACGTTAINDGEWHHTAFVYNSVNWTIYIDGVYSGFREISTNTAVGGTAEIGRQIGGGYYFNGNVEEIMIINQTLTSTQVSNIYKNQSVRYSSSGIQEVKSFNITSNVNQYNISLQNYHREHGTNISVRVGTWDIANDYNTSDLGSPNGLVLYYNFDNSSALGENQTLVVDRTAASNNGTLKNGASTTSDSVYGRALSLNGIDQNVFLRGKSLGLDAGIIDTLTFTAWVKHNDLEGIDISGDGLVTADNTGGWGIGLTSSGTIFLTNVGLTATYSTGAITAGTWQFIAVTLNSTNLTFYINGLMDSSHISYHGLSGDNGNYSIGGRDISQAAYLDGKLDELMVFNRSLTPTEVKELYVKGRALWTYSAYQNITARDSNDNWSLNNFTIPTTTTNVLPSFLLLSDSNKFYTPILQATSTAPANVTTENVATPTSCTYSGSGNWAVNASDNCTITSNVNLGKNNFSITGIGRFTLDGANISNYTKGYIAGSTGANDVAVRVINRGKFVSSFVLGLLSLLGISLALPVLLHDLPSVITQTSLYSSQRVIGGIR